MGRVQELKHAAKLQEWDDTCGRMPKQRDYSVKKYLRRDMDRNLDAMDALIQSAAKKYVK